MRFCSLPARRILRVMLVLWIAVGAIVPRCAAADERDVVARLASIRTDVGATERGLEQLKTDFAKLKKEERSLEAAITRLIAEERRLVSRGEQLSVEKENLAKQVRVAEEALERQHMLVKERLRVLYMNKAISVAPIFLSSAKEADPERIAFYARSVRAYDDSRFRAVKRAVEELIAARHALDRALVEGKNVQHSLLNKRTEVEAQREKLKSVIQQIKEKQGIAQQTLSRLRSEAAKLEEVLRAITGGEKAPSVEEELETLVQPTVPRDAPVKPTAVPEAPINADSGRRPQDVMHPEGLFGKTVRVVYPVKGDVLRRFGKAKVTDFSDMIFSKGLEYKTAEGSQVRAVLGGKIAFVGVMPGYDTVVIIDHGSRSYSLYGRLGKSLVQKGDFVAQRDAVGVTSSPDSKGRNFYFETRKNGSPVDPSSVLARAL